MLISEFHEGPPGSSHPSRPPRPQNQGDRSFRPVDRDDVEAQGNPLPRLLPISDAAAAYRLVYGRVDALLRGRADVAELAVPACPAWTIRQTVAHLDE